MSFHLRPDTVMPTATETKRGAKAAPRRSLSDEFRQAITRSGRHVWALSVLSGFGHSSKLSPLLYHPFAATPLAMERLRILASIIGYDGPLLSERTDA